jgi:hypothetical protein
LFNISYFVCVFKPVSSFIVCLDRNGN